MKFRVHLTIDGVIETPEVALTDISQLIGNLRVRRLSKGLTLKQLSQASGVSTSEIQRIEKGQRRPGAHILIRLEKALRGGENGE